MLNINKEIPSGNIEVVELTSKEHPGIIIDIAGKQAVRVEYDTQKKQYGIYVWDGKKEDYVHKTIFEQPIP